MSTKNIWAGFVFCQLDEDDAAEIESSEALFLTEGSAWIEGMTTEGYLFAIKPISDNTGYVASLFGVLPGHKHLGMKLTGEADTIALATAVLWVKYHKLEGTWHVAAKSDNKPRYR